MIIVLGENMSIITLKCKNCGSDLSINHDSKTITCLHCGSTFMMVDLLDEHDVAFSKNMKPQDLETKIEFAEALKQGETYLYKAEYQLAEQSFKRAIELNNKNYKGYWGVVKAKTSNLNKIPDEKDYYEYAKLAIKYVDKDDKVYLESECVKLDLLIKEKEDQKKSKRAQDQKLARQEQHIRDTETFFGYITIFMIAFITGIILLFIGMSALDDHAPKADASTYEISTKAELKAVLSQEDLLSCTIILKNDIDFADEEWDPIGSKETPFSGKIYGNNHKISNLKITPTVGEGDLFSGFISYAKGATITGLLFDNISLSEQHTADHSTTHYVGLICGYAENTTISRCSIYKNCKLTINNKNHFTLVAGGLVGKLNNSKIAYSYSNADISATVLNITAEEPSGLSFKIGGLVGELASSKITHSYSASDIDTNLTSTLSSDITLNLAGAVGYWHTQTNLEDMISNVFFTGSVDANIESPNNHTYISGIVAFGANADHMNLNFAILDSSTYKINSHALSTDSFNDYSNRPTSVKYYASTNILEYIEQYFAGDVWTNTTTLTPTLRAS